MPVNIKHELIRINAAYLRENINEIAEVIQRVLSLPEREVDTFMSSPTIQALIIYAYNNNPTDIFILLLLALDPTKPYTKQIMDALTSSQYFNRGYLPYPSDDLLSQTCTLDYLDTLMKDFDEAQFNSDQQVELETQVDSQETPEVTPKCTVSNKLRKRIIESLSLNLYFYTAALMSVFNNHQGSYLNPEETHLATDLILLINNKDTWPLVEDIILSDEQEWEFLFAEFLEEAIANKDINACTFLLNIELEASIESEVIASFIRQCREIQFDEGVSLLKSHFSFGAARLIPCTFWSEKKRKVEMDAISQESSASNENSASDESSCQESQSPQFTQ